MASRPETEQGGSAGTGERTALDDSSALRPGETQPHSLASPAAGVPPKAAGLNSWFAELKRRRVVRTLVGYGIASFAVLQIIEPVMHGLHWPETVLSYVVVALAAGFPVVITLAWIFDVKAGRLERTASPTAATGPRGIQLALLFLGLGLFAAAPGLFYYFVVRGISRSPANAPSSSSSANKMNSLVVLPFMNTSGNADAEYLSDGIAEGLINSLSQIRDLRVIARTTAFRYKGKELDFEGLRRQLSVDSVLSGRVQQVGNKLVVQADLVETSSGSQLWGEQYNRPIADALFIQEEITKAITEKLRPRLTREVHDRVARRYTDNSEAYQLYLRGRFFLFKPTKDGLAKSREYFQKAIELDPNYALAYTGLANSYALAPQWTNASSLEGDRLARAAALKALALDDQLAEAHMSLGLVSTVTWDWTDVEKEYKRAIELKPNYASAHNNYGVYLSAMGRTEEALAEHKIALQLDPAWIVPATNIGASYCRLGQYDRGMAAVKDALALDPNFVPAHATLASCYLLQKMYAEAIAALKEARSRDSGSPRILGLLAYADAVSGNREDALGIVEALKSAAETDDDAPLSIAQVFVGLDDREHAFEWLEKAYQRRAWGLRMLKTAFTLDPLRSDPRFKDLLRRVGLPP